MASPIPDFSELRLHASRFDVAIVGGGFSGCSLAAHLLRLWPKLRVAVVEKTSAPGRGVAYSAQARFHLLNVPAGNMSMVPDVPDHFLKWTRKYYDASVQPRSFVARNVFGDYVAWFLESAIADGDPERFCWIKAEACALKSADRGWQVQCTTGQIIAADAVVVATGNFPPANPRLPGLDAASRRYFPFAWSKTTLEGLSQRGSVLLIGSGLTSVDLTMALRSRHFRGHIYIVSRHGLLPHRFQPAKAWTQFWSRRVPRTVRGLLRMIRAEVRRAREAGVGWRAVIDALRPVTQDIWQSLPIEEQRRFLRHARAYWEVHRHRLAPEIADVLSDLVRERQVRICAGRVIRYEERKAFAEVTFRERRNGATHLLRVDRVINCTGSENDCRRIESPFIRSLLSQGYARPDPLFLGLDVDDTGALLDADGHASESLFALGPARRGHLWETTAVPEIRAQSMALAEKLVAQLAPESQLLHR